MRVEPLPNILCQQWEGRGGSFFMANAVCYYKVAYLCTLEPTDCLAFAIKKF